MAKLHQYPKRKRSELIFANSELLDDMTDGLDYESANENLEGDNARVKEKVNRQGKLRNLAAAKVADPDVPIMFTDLKGPIKTAGTRGEVHYQAFIASHTKYVICYCMKFKSAALETLRDLLEVQLPAEGSRIVTYCADGAPELISRDIVRLLSAHKCKMMYAPPYTSGLNAVVERNHRTAFESGHAMLSASNLPTIFWCYAVKYAVLIYNHTD